MSTPDRGETPTSAAADASGAATAGGAAGTSGTTRTGAAGATEAHRNGEVLRARYRRLMLCYPRDYRRERSDDLLTTMVEAAGPARRRPTAREAANLVTHGLRARIGRPTSRTVVVWVLLATLLGGVFGASAGVWAAWWAAPPRPDPARTEALLHEALPGARDVVSSTPRDRFTQSLIDVADWATESGDHGTAIMSAHLTADPGEAADGLRSAGWAVGGPFVTATRDGLRITVTEADGTFLHVHRAAPWALWPAAIVAGALAAAGTFLAVAWAARRTGEPGHPARRPAVAFYTGAMVLLCLPALAGVPFPALRGLIGPHPITVLPWDGLGWPTPLLLWGVGAAAALAGLSLATIPARAKKPVRA